MAVDAIGSSTQSANQANGYSAMTSSDFTKIILSELGRQDPLAPNDTNQLVQQIANIRGIQSDMDLGDRLSRLVSHDEFRRGGRAHGPAGERRERRVRPHHGQSGGGGADDGAAVLRLEDGTSVKLAASMRWRRRPVKSVTESNSCTLGSGVLPPGVNRAGGSATIDRMGFAELLSSTCGRHGERDPRSRGERRGRHAQRRTVATPPERSGRRGEAKARRALARLHRRQGPAHGCTTGYRARRGGPQRRRDRDRHRLGHLAPGKNSGADAPAGIVPPPSRGVLGLTPDVLAALGKIQK
ncbi:MAG: hypothetical protein IPI84_12515 [Holophagaceae bacterium]|nr:hypothetical protein [Holophagaceae bacterium]